MKIIVERWSEAQFRDAGRGWQELLADSDADPLFSSWDWLYLWWELFAPLLGGELVLLAAYDEGRQLLGLAPLYLSRVAVKSLFPVDRLQPLGCCWHRRHITKSEHPGFILRRGHEPRVTQALLLQVSELPRWDELIVSGQEPGSAVARGVAAAGGQRVRTVAGPRSFVIPLAGGFQDYLASLGSKTRLHLYNRRTQLARRGAVELTWAVEGEIGRYFVLLNALHLQRWGKPAFSGHTLQFQKRLAERLARRGALRLSILRVGSRPVSVFYDLRAGDREYGIQLAFDAAHDRRLSIGLLHMGYMLEAAFGDGLSQFDLLAGQGRRGEYKHHLARQGHRLDAMVWVRSGWLSMAYRAHDLLTGRSALPGLEAAPACAQT